MAYVAHETELDRQTDGTSLRAIYEDKLRRGDTSVLPKLIGPDYPDELEYLNDWRLQLHGRSGVGMAGFSPLSYSTIADWSRLTGNEPTPDEVTALLRLDATMLAPAPAETPTAETAPVDVRAWPTKKGG